jgi:heat shock protein HslJ
MSSFAPVLQNLATRVAGRNFPVVLVAATLICAVQAYAAEWRIVLVNGGAVQGEPSMVFAEDGSISGTTGCNGFRAAGKMLGATIAVEGPVATTRMACNGDELEAQENEILALLEGLVAVRFDPFDDRLILSGTATSLEMVCCRR